MRSLTAAESVRYFNDEDDIPTARFTGACTVSVDSQIV
jgi:hypothetical protein